MQREVPAHQQAKEAQDCVPECTAAVTGSRCGATQPRVQIKTNAADDVRVPSAVAEQMRCAQRAYQQMR